VQLDVDHIDGDHTNNELNNLQTLCANCHRLKTQVNNDHTWVMLRDD
jgi:5-methylcytosine-specific restriction endonuclease McrA